MDVEEEEDGTTWMPVVVMTGQVLIEVEFLLPAAELEPLDNELAAELEIRVADEDKGVDELAREEDEVTARRGGSEVSNEAGATEGARPAKRKVASPLIAERKLHPDADRPPA